MWIGRSLKRRAELCHLCMPPCCMAYYDRIDRFNMCLPFKWWFKEWPVTKGFPPWPTAIYEDLFSSFHVHGSIMAPSGTFFYYPRLFQAGCPRGRTGDRSIGRDKKQWIKDQKGKLSLSQWQGTPQPALFPQPETLGHTCMGLGI